MRNIWRDEKRFAFPHEMIHDAIAFADAHLDVAFELVKVFLRIDEMKIVPRVRAFDDHHEKITAIIKITVAHRRFEFVAVLFDPIFPDQSAVAQSSWRTAYLVRRAASNGLNPASAPVTN